MINLRKTKAQEIKKIIKAIKKDNRENWLSKLSDILESKGYKTELTSTCSNGHYSGKVVEKKNEIKVFSYGTQVRARSGFTYDIYPTLIVKGK